MAINKKMWMKIHTYLSLFFLPVAFIYAITGVLYIFDIKDTSGANVQTIKLESAPKTGEERDFIINVLKENNLKIPQNTEVKILKNNPAMGSIKYQVILIKNNDGSLSLRAIERSIYGILVLMHKSKGQKNEILGFNISYFDFIAIGFGLSLIIFYLSGLIVTSFCKKNRTNALLTLLAGLVVSIIAIYFTI